MHTEPTRVKHQREGVWKSGCERGSCHGGPSHYLSATLIPLPTLPGYVDMGVIPEGARDILVREAEEAGNFLALRSVGSGEYFLNGNFIIQWNGEYEAGGTTFYYERSGDMENLTAPGPTKQPVLLQVGCPFHRSEWKQLFFFSCSEVLV